MTIDQQQTGGVKIIKNLDSNSLTEIFLDNYPKIFRYISYRVNHREEAEDLASEVFSRFLKYNGRLKSSLLGLLYKIAENIVVDYYRRRKIRNDALSYSDNLDIHPDQQSDCFGSMRHDDLRKALINLTGEQYQVVILRFLEGHSIRETGEITGKSDNAVKALQFRALKTMKNFFTEDIPCEGQ